MKLSEIYEGWRNTVIPPEHLKDIVETVSALRLKECSNCSFHSKFHNSIRPDDHCTKCGCTLIAKTKCLSCQCPLSPPKWTFVKTDE